MLALTPDATTAIRELLSSAPLPEGGGLRIATTRDDARVFLEPEAATLLEEKTLDVQPTLDEGVTFVITPRASEG